MYANFGQSGNFHFQCLKIGSSADFYFISEKARSYSLCWSQASGSYSSYLDDLTYLGQIDQVRKHISLPFSFLVKFLPKFNLFTLNLQKLLASKEVGSDAKREIPWSFYKYFMLRTRLFSLKKITCCFYELSMLSLIQNHYSHSKPKLLLDEPK